MTKKKRIILLAIIGTLIMLTLALTLTYSFVKPFKEEKSNSNITLTACAKISLKDDAKTIELTNTFPMDDALGLETNPYEFTVSSTCDTYVGFNLYFSSLNGNEIADDNIKYALKNANNDEIIATGLIGDLTITPETEFTETERHELELEVGEVQTIYKAIELKVPYKSENSYKLYIWVDKDTTNETMKQNYTLGVSLKAFERKADNYLDHSLIGKTYHSNTYKDQIKNIYFVNEIKDESTISQFENWDLSERQNKGIIGWLESSGDDAVPYNLYIGSNDVIQFKDMSSAFSEMTKVETINFNNIDTHEVTTMNLMFSGATNLATITGIENIKTSQVTAMTAMFQNASALTTLDLSGWDTSNVNNMGWMFYNNSALTTLDLSGWDTSNVTTLESMFFGCTNLSKIIGIEDWDVSHVKTIKWLFSSNKMTTLNLSKWKTTDLEIMNAAFENCKSLTSINLTGWDTSKVTDMAFLFNDDILLKEILGIENFKTNLVLTMRNTFYNNAAMTSLNLGNWDTSSVTDTAWMFNGCTSLTSLDFRQATFKSVTTSSVMFANVPSEIQVIVKDTDAQTFIQNALGAGKGKVTIG